MQYIAKNLFSGLWEWQELITSPKEKKGTVAPDCCLGSSSTTRRPLGSGGLDPLLLHGDDDLVIPSSDPRSSQEEEGTVAPDSCLGSRRTTRRPLGSGGLDPLLLRGGDDDLVIPSSNPRSSRSGGGRIRRPR